MAPSLLSLDDPVPCAGHWRAAVSREKQTLFPAPSRPCEKALGHLPPCGPALPPVGETRTCIDCHGDGITVSCPSCARYGA